MKSTLFFSLLAVAATAFGSAEPVEKRALSPSGLLSGLKNLEAKVMVQTNDILDVSASLDPTSTVDEIDAATSAIAADLQTINGYITSFNAQVGGNVGVNVKREIEARFVRFPRRRFGRFRPFRPFPFRRPRFFNRQRINNKGRNRGGDKQGGGRGGGRNGGGGGGGAVVTIGDVGGNTNTNTNTATNNGGAADAAGANVDGLADTFAGIISDILDALAAADDAGALDGLDALITGLVGSLNTLIGSLGAAVAGLGPAIQAAIAPLLTNLTTTIAALIAQLGN